MRNYTLIERPLLGSALRVSCAMVLGPLLCVLALAAVYFVAGLSFSGLFDFSTSSGYSIWLGIVFLATIGFVHSVMLAILSSALAKFAPLKGYAMVMSGLIVACGFAFVFALVGGQYFAVLGVILLLMVAAFELARLSFDICKPYLRWSAIRPTNQST